MFTLVLAFLHMINRHGRLDSRIFKKKKNFNSFWPVPRQTTAPPHMCQATFSTRHSQTDPSEMYFPSCCNGSSKRANGVPLCRGPRLRECTSHGSARDCVGGWNALLALFTVPPNHQRQPRAVADKKEVKLLKTWTSRLGVERAVGGVELKEMPLRSSLALLRNPNVCRC